jgi:hypothetical protein
MTEHRLTQRAQMMWEVKGAKEIADRCECEETKRQYVTSISRIVQKRCQELYNEIGAMSPQNPFAGLLFGVHTILCLGHRSFCFQRRGAKGSAS